MKPIALCLLSPFLASMAYSGERLDRMLDNLHARLGVATEDGTLRAQLSGTLDLEFHAFDRPPPDLIETDESWAFQPRATFFLDVQAGPMLYAFAQARVDRGFDPSEGDPRGRIDEYAVRLTPWRDGRFNLQAGQFATVVGQWVKRHLSWDNPFVTAPLFYEHVTRISDLRAPGSYYPPGYSGSDSAYDYNPIIWGPSYTTGVAASGHWKQFEWAFEFKNAALMSRPAYWAWSDTDFDHPTIGGRVAWRPDLRWTLGLSMSRGTYLGPSATEALPDSAEPEHYRQTVYLADLTYAFHHLQFWAEVVHAHFAVPYGDSLRSTAYFLEAKYKFAPRLSGAIRWNQQFPDSPDDTWGESESEDESRLDLAVTWRFDAHSQIQVEGNWYFADARRESGLAGAIRYTLRF